MNKKIVGLILFFTFAFLALLVSVDGSGIGSNVGTGTSRISINPSADTYWRRPWLQGIRITLVDRETGIRIPNTRSVDYVNNRGYNNYLTPNNGKRSKTEYLTGGANIGHRSSFVQFTYKTPPTLLPKFVANDNAPATIMSDYFINGYSPTQNPHNLKRLLRDLSIGGSLNTLIDAIDEAGKCSVNFNCNAVEESPNLLQFNDYVFMVEPIGFVTIWTSQEGTRNYAMTSTELGYFLDDFPGWVRGYSHGAVPVSMYLLDDEFDGHSNRLRAPSTPSSTTRYRSNTMTSDLGIGVGVFDIIFDGFIKPNYCTPEPEYNVDNCNESAASEIYYKDDPSFKCLLESEDADRINDYCTFVCSEQAKADFPTGEINPIDYTHFTFGPPTTELTRSCLLQINLDGPDGWISDYQSLVQTAQTQYSRLRQARIELAAYERARDMALNGSSNSSFTTADGVSGTVEVERIGPCTTGTETHTHEISRVLGGSPIQNQKEIRNDDNQYLATLHHYQYLCSNQFAGFPKTTNNWARRVEGRNTDITSDHVRCYGATPAPPPPVPPPGGGGYIIIPQSFNILGGQSSLMQINYSSYNCYFATRFNHNYVPKSGSEHPKCVLSSSRVDGAHMGVGQNGRRTAGTSSDYLHNFESSSAARNILHSTDDNVSGPFPTETNAGVYCGVSYYGGSTTIRSGLSGEGEASVWDGHGNTIVLEASRESQKCYLTIGERVEIGDRYRYRYRLDGGSWTSWAPSGGTCTFDQLSSYQQSVNYWYDQLGAPITGTLDRLNGLRNALDECSKSFTYEPPEFPIMEAIHNQDNFDQKVYQLRRELTSEEKSGPNKIESESSLPTSYYCSGSGLTGCQTVSISTNHSRHGMPINSTNFLDRIAGSVTYKHEFNLEDHVNKYIKIPENVTNDNLTYSEITSLWGPHHISGRIRSMDYPNYAIEWEEGQENTGGTLTLRYRNLSRLNEVYSGSLLEGNGNWFRYTCPYEVERYIPGGNGDGRVRNFIFRTIDLDTPFVTETGQERVPGFNWRIKPEYILEITQNRGVSGNDLYRSGKDPMYTIDFTGANKFRIRDIRNYNNSNPYDDFDMECTEGEMCRSRFLRSQNNNIMSNVISGCGLNATIHNWDNPCND